jgi:small-conductance mechanosensitive channel
VSAVVAVITVVLGVAARPLIENAMSGLVISYSRLVNLGDTVRIDDVYGTVEDITITHTTIKVWDWRRYIVPNSKMIQHSFYNYSVVDKFEWTYVDFWIAYDADFEAVEKIAREIPTKSKHFADYEEPQVWVMELAPEGMRCWLAAWANAPSDAWYLRNDMRTELVRELAKAGIATHLRRHELTDRRKAAA